MAIQVLDIGSLSKSSIAVIYETNKEELERNDYFFVSVSICDSESYNLLTK